MHQAMDQAIEEASDEVGLAPHYRACVRPLVRDPNGPWPRCCGGGCEPCAQTLVDAAVRALEKLGQKRTAPMP